MLRLLLHSVAAMAVSLAAILAGLQLVDPPQPEMLIAAPSLRVIPADVVCAPVRSPPPLDPKSRKKRIA